MTDIKDLLNNLGVELNDEAKSNFLAEHAKSYKSAAELERKVNKAIQERDALNEQLKSVKEDLQKFDGVDIESLRKQIDDANAKAQSAEREYREKMAERDELDAITRELSKYKFSSLAAQDAISQKIKAAKLPIADGGIIGLSELMHKLQEEDPGAFIDETERKAQFTKPLDNKSGQKVTDLNGKAFAKMSYWEKVEMKRTNPELYEKMKN